MYIVNINIGFRILIYTEHLLDYCQCIHENLLALFVSSDRFYNPSEVSLFMWDNDVNMTYFFRHILLN